MRTPSFGYQLFTNPNNTIASSIAFQHASNRSYSLQKPTGVLPLARGGYLYSTPKETTVAIEKGLPIIQLQAFNQTAIEPNRVEDYKLTLKK